MEKPQPFFSSRPVPLVILFVHSPKTSPATSPRMEGDFTPSRTHFVAQKTSSTTTFLPSHFVPPTARLSFFQRTLQLTPPACIPPFLRVSGPHSPFLLTEYFVSLHHAPRRHFPFLTGSTRASAPHNPLQKNHTLQPPLSSVLHHYGHPLCPPPLLISANPVGALLLDSMFPKGVRASLKPITHLHVKFRLLRLPPTTATQMTLSPPPLSIRTHLALPLLWFLGFLSGFSTMSPPVSLTVHSTVT